MLHLELTNGMSSDEFLQAFQCMINCRGMSDTVWSDNAQSFKAAIQEIKWMFASSTAEAKKVWKKIDKYKVKSELASKGIKWKYIVGHSPWTGGWWERFCRSAKDPLRESSPHLHRALYRSYRSRSNHQCSSLNLCGR